MESIRKLLVTYAYNILGSFEDAKDVVQDTYLKTSNRCFDNIENKRAYLIRTVINLSINLKNRQKKLVHQYPGDWLPEPIATERADTAVIKKEILSYSLLVLLEKLSAKQRAVFILKEAFDYDHKEIATALDITEENSRKLFSRAKKELKEPNTFGNTSIAPDYLDQYIEVIYNADTKRLECLLQKDIVAVTDGGGKASAAIQPVFGKSHVIKYMVGIHLKFYARGSCSRIEQSIINHQPALLVYKGGILSLCQIFDIQDGHIARIYMIRNPDKLHSL